MYILTLSPFLIYEGRSKILQVHFHLAPSVDKRTIDHNYINFRFAGYRWSVIEQTGTPSPPPPPHTPIPGNMCVCVGGGGGFWLPVCTLLTTRRLRTSRYTGNREICKAENVTYIAHALGCEHISDTCIPTCTC